MTILLIIQIAVMGNQTCHGVCVGNDNQPFSLGNISAGTVDEPLSEFAIYIDKERHQIPCDVNHVLASLEHEKFKLPADHQPGVLLKEGYYRIRQFNIDYCGQWKHGLPHGSGEVIFQDGAVFKGPFYRGVARGPDCLHITRNGAYYRGEIQNNKRQGNGTLIDHGYSYVGHWINNLPEGTNGKQLFPNGDTFEGEFKQGEKHGKGIYTWFSNKQFKQFEGQFKNNYINGVGKLIRRNGQAIEGEFGFTDEHEQDENIKKCLISSKDLIFKGELIRGVPIGKFTLDKKGTVFKGELRNGKMHGDVEGAGHELVFQGKKLLDLKALSEEETRKILTVIQKVYATAAKHSQALKKIRQQLKQYYCAHITIEQMRKSAKGYRQFLLVEICGKSLLVQREKQ